MGQVRDFFRIGAPFLYTVAAEVGLRPFREPAGRPMFATVTLSLEQMDAAQAEWADLAARAREPNAFCEPGFALSAARHFPPGERPRFIVVRDPAGRFAGVFPLAPSGLPGADGLVHLWADKMTALATPLVDCDQAADVIAAFLDWVGEKSPAAGVIFPRITADGQFCEALRKAAASRGRRLDILDPHVRAALRPGASVDEKWAQAGERKAVNEIHRLRRRLAEMGRVEVEFCGAPAQVGAAVEEFLALEAAGWKRGRGAFLSSPALTTFLRSATRLLSREGLCRVAALRLDGRAVAMAILLENQGHSCCWKIAFDERLRGQAPGIQLLYELTRIQLARPEIEITDSCAIPNHPTINRLWPDRIPICDAVVALRHAGFDAIYRREKARRRMRELAKRAANRLFKRKVS